MFVILMVVLLSEIIKLSEWIIVQILTGKVSYKVFFTIQIKLNNMVKFHRYFKEILLNYIFEEFYWRFKWDNYSLNFIFTESVFITSWTSASVCPYVKNFKKLLLANMAYKKRFHLDLMLATRLESGGQRMVTSDSASTLRTRAQPPPTYQPMSEQSSSWPDTLAR